MTLEWLRTADVAALLGITPGRVHQLDVRLKPKRRRCRSCGSCGERRYDPKIIEREIKRRLDEHERREALRDAIRQRAARG